VSRSLKAHILLVLITLIWGVTFVVIKNALADISPLFFNSTRMTLAAITLTAVFHRDLRHLTKKSLLYGVILGVLLWFGNELQTVGLKFTTPFEISVSDWPVRRAGAGFSGVVLET
jgi:drug/metabolite transporter (DMT)-like permease